MQPLFCCCTHTKTREKKFQSIGGCLCRADGCHQNWNIQERRKNQERKKETTRRTVGANPSVDYLFKIYWKCSICVDLSHRPPFDSQSILRIVWGTCSPFKVEHVNSFEMDTTSISSKGGGIGGFGKTSQISGQLCKYTNVVKGKFAIRNEMWFCYRKCLPLKMFDRLAISMVHGWPTSWNTQLLFMW